MNQKCKSLLRVNRDLIPMNLIYFLSAFSVFKQHFFKAAVEKIALLLLIEHENFKLPIL